MKEATVSLTLARSISALQNVRRDTAGSQHRPFGISSQLPGVSPAGPPRYDELESRPAEPPTVQHPIPAAVLWTSVVCPLSALMSVCNWPDTSMLGTGISEPTAPPTSWASRRVQVIQELSCRRRPRNRRRSPSRDCERPGRSRDVELILP